MRRQLATAVSLMAREKGEPRIAFQVLVYPVTDRNFTTKSYQDNVVGHGLGKDGMITNWAQYLAKDGVRQAAGAHALRGVGAKALRLAWPPF